MRFFALYKPLEFTLRRFSEWRQWGIDIEAVGQTCALTRDLAALRCHASSIPSAPDNILPNLHTFPAALGALYVLEGSKLGGRFILRDLEGRLGAGIAGADAFFAGHGSQTNPMWNDFRSSIDRFAAERPEDLNEVITGAQNTFAAIQQWMSPLQLSGSALSTQG